LEKDVTVKTLEIQRTQVGACSDYQPRQQHSTPCVKICWNWGVFWTVLTCSVWRFVYIR